MFDTSYELHTNNARGWKGHIPFSRWLVQILQPNVTVELGVQYGDSLIELAKNNPGTVYGIDTFTGDSHTGPYDKDFAIETVHYSLRFFNLNNVKLIVNDFKNACNSWDKAINILHIDGYHTYEDTKLTYNDWIKFVTESGVILLHDTESYEGVKRFYNEITLPKCNFTHSFGLGVISKDKFIIAKICEAFDIT